MGWFSKNKKEARPLSSAQPPELSKLPELPPLPPLKSQLSEYPGFPEIQEKQRFSQQQKSFQIPAETELPALPSFSKKELNLDKAEITGTIKPFTKELEEPAIQNFLRTKKEILQSSAKEPIFVRLDKYQEALGNFQEIKNKILEIENLLREIKEIKTREEAELQGWEREIQEAKSKLHQIDNALFKQLE